MEQTFTEIKADLLPELLERTNRTPSELKSSFSALMESIDASVIDDTKWRKGKFLFTLFNGGKILRITKKEDNNDKIVTSFYGSNIFGVVNETDVELLFSIGVFRKNKNKKPKTEK